jgi:hypothetical protein
MKINGDLVCFNRMRFRRCIHQLEDGTLCSQVALKNSPRCRHHQLDPRQGRRRQAAKQAGLDCRSDVMVQTFAGILFDPHSNRSDELRATKRFRKVGWIGDGQQRAIHEFLALQKETMAKFSLRPAALQYILNNHDKVRQ